MFHEKVLHIPLAETIKELNNFILKDVDLYDDTKVFLWRASKEYFSVIVQIYAF